MRQDRGTIQGGRSDEGLLLAWIELAARMGARGNARAAGTQVLRCYQEGHRRYHNLVHLAECLALAEEASGDLQDADAVRCALYFHDAVYVVGAADNEARSAELARRTLSGLGLPEEQVRLVERLVLCTDHRAPPSDGDARHVVDIDLSILGQPPARYAEYAAAIEAEAGLPPAEFARRRAAFLEGMLARGRLFHTERFAARFEPPARSNMLEELERLRPRTQDASPDR